MKNFSILTNLFIVLCAVVTIELISNYLIDIRVTQLAERVEKMQAEESIRLVIKTMNCAKAFVLFIAFFVAVLIVDKFQKVVATPPAKKKSTTKNKSAKKTTPAKRTPIKMIEDPDQPGVYYKVSA